ncbi:MAG: hypothetical protein ACJ735_04205 [Actinomycetes bacterium]
MARQQTVSAHPSPADRPKRRIAAALAAVAGVPMLVAGGAAGIVHGFSSSGTVRVSAVDDAYVLAPGGDQARAYLKFQLSGIPAGADIASADLILHGAEPLPADLRVNGVRSLSWRGMWLDGRTAPQPTAPAVTANLAGSSNSAVVDVTSLVHRAGAVGMTVSAPGGALHLVPHATGAAAAQLRVTWRRSHGRSTTPSAPAPDDGGLAEGAPIVGSLAPTPPTPNCTVSALLVPSCGVWFGAMANSGNSGLTTDQAFSKLEAEVGRPFDIDHYYYKDDQHFPSQTLINRANQVGENHLLLLNWKPATDHTWADVAAGRVDARIDSEAAYLKTHFTKKFFLVIWHEPENDVIPTAGSGMTAPDYAAMWRHTVLRLRADGVTNAVTVLCYEGTPEWGSTSWFPQLWPGGDVVDWMAEDPYTFGNGAIWGGGFAQTINRVDHYSYPNWDGFYTWAQHIAPDKPIMIPEYGVQDVAGDPGHKAAFFNNEARDLASLPAVKAVVYWNYPGDAWAIDSSPTALAAFRGFAQQDMVNPQTAYAEHFN